MSWLFGSSKTPQEIIREHQRTLQRSMRELDRERVKLEQQEVKLKNDIKKSAKAGQMVCVGTRASAQAHERTSATTGEPDGGPAGCHGTRAHTRRTRPRSWPRTWSGHGGTFKSFTRCTRSSRP